jgi:RimJ/RimL family protein N-acetyltransferase
MLNEGDIILRPFYDNDAEVLAQLINNKKIWDNLRDYIPFPYSVDDAVFFIRQTQKENPQMSFAIEFDQQFCGAIGLIGQSDVYKKTAELGYWLGEKYWNKGLATVSVKLITDYAINELDFIRVHTGVFEYNAGSMRVLIKNGYTKDGIFRKSILKNERILDEHRFSLTK